MTNPPTDFIKYANTPYQHYILPIIPAGAPLKEDSGLTPDQLGKIPGKFFPGPKLWAGFYNWPNNMTTPTMLERWQHWQDPDQAATTFASGLRTGVVIAVDIDIDDEAVGALTQHVEKRHIQSQPPLAKSPYSRGTNVSVRPPG